MAGDTWFDAYGGETTEELLALEGTHRIDSLVLAFEEAIQGKAAGPDLEGGALRARNRGPREGGQ